MLTHQVDDPTFLTQDEEQAELQSRGKIEVVLQRGKYRHTEKMHCEDKDHEMTAAMFMPSETTKKVAREQGRSHYLK